MDGALSDAELNEFQVSSLSYDGFIVGFHFTFRSLTFVFFKKKKYIEQVKCFTTPLQPAEIVCVKRVVQEKLPDGVNQFGLTLTGFIFLHALFIEKGRLETIWAVLRKFGYDDDLKLRDDFLPVQSKCAPDQVINWTFHYNKIPSVNLCQRSQVMNLVMLFISMENVIMILGV